MEGELSIPRNCVSCAFYQPDTPSAPYGICRRLPPHPGEIGERWPRVRKNDWCGEWVYKPKTTTSERQDG